MVGQIHSSLVHLRPAAAGGCVLLHSVCYLIGVGTGRVVLIIRCIDS